MKIYSTYYKNQDKFKIEPNKIQKVFGDFSLVEENSHIRDNLEFFAFVAILVSILLFKFFQSSFIFQNDS